MDSDGASTPVAASEPEVSTPASRPLTPSEQARIRRERREAKIRAGGTDRLNRITGASRGEAPSATASVSDGNCSILG
jgi:hypothetical protein